MTDRRSDCDPFKELRQARSLLDAIGMHTWPCGMYSIVSARRQRTRLRIGGEGETEAVIGTPRDGSHDRGALQHVVAPMPTTRSGVSKVYKHEHDHDQVR
jgi:hypothetical protein